MKRTLSESDKDYVFKDRKGCQFVTRNKYGEGALMIETLYQAFAERFAKEYGLKKVKK